MSTVALGLPGLTRAPGAGRDPARPRTEALLDSHGRVATDLRISLTDRCNLRCTYCMPAEGLDWLPGEDVLSGEEIVRLVALATGRLGVKEVRFTGGEPLLRGDLVDVVAACAALPSAPEMSVTTNGLALARKAAAAGARPACTASTSRSTPSTPTGSPRSPGGTGSATWSPASQAAVDAGLTPVKINAVLQRGRQRRRGPRPARLLPRQRLRAAHHRADAAGRPARLGALQHGDGGGDPGLAAHPVPASPRSVSRAVAPPPSGGWSTAAPRRSGVIASVTRPFCGACDRTRITADGQLRNCLFATGETDLRALLRSGASDDEIAACWQDATWLKRAGHGIDDPGFLQPDRPMSAIGG